jgi:hypothetical protein
MLHKIQVYRHILLNRHLRNATFPKVVTLGRNVAKFGLLLVLFEVYTRLLRMEKAQGMAYATAWSTVRLHSDVRDLPDWDPILNWIKSQLHMIQQMNMLGTFPMAPVSFMVDVVSQYLSVLITTIIGTRTIRRQKKRLTIVSFNGNESDNRSMFHV